MHTWTVNEPDEIRRFIADRVASLITDVPDVALGVRAEVAAAASSA